MSSLTNINNNSSVVNVGRTTPVSPGQQTSDKSIPVVIASDQKAIPVAEQNKVLSEVALSLLGIPRSEVALGIFADVNTYDVNPSEWSAVPTEYTLNSSAGGWGIKHLPDEAGALIEAPKDKVAVLTSKRFFRYQPGRVSAATFGVKSTVSPSSNVTANSLDLNPSIRKYGIFDKFDGYYWETRADGVDDNFSVVRRTQSLLRSNPVKYGTDGQLSDHALSGKAPNVYEEEPNALPTATKVLIDNRFAIIEEAFADALNDGGVQSAALAALSNALKAKCKRDMNLAMEAYIYDLQYNGNAHSIVNATTYRLAEVGTTQAEKEVEKLVHRKLALAIRAALVNAGETTAANKVFNPTATAVTFNATTDIFTYASNHGLTTGDAVEITGTTPPSGLVLNKTYYVRVLSGTTMELHTDYESAATGGANKAVGTTNGTGISIVNLTPTSSQLVYWTLLALDNPTTKPDSTEINAASYGSRSPVATIFSVYSRFIGYIASEYTFDADNNIIVTPAYLSSSASLSPEEIKYRCYRDIGYIVKGYAEDLEFGGDASTIYNAKRYYFTSLATVIYSQTPGGATGEIRRHQFVRKLLTGWNNNGTEETTFLIPTSGGKSFTCVTSLFPNVFTSGNNFRTKLRSLSTLIIDNFGTEYSGNIEYGRGGNYGDLVVLRDGLIMTHAAVFDPSLLKPTKNVVVKPGFFSNTTATGTAVTAPTTQNITVASGTGLTKGMSVAGTNIVPGTYVANVSGTTVTLSRPLTASISSQPIAFGTSTIEVSEGEFVVGQHINFYGTEAGANSNGLVANRLYKVEKVRGAQGNILTLSSAVTKNKFNANIALVGNPVTSAVLTVASDPDSIRSTQLLPGARIEGKGLPEGTYLDTVSGQGWTINSPNGLPSNALTNVEVTVIAVIAPDVNPISPTKIYINPNVPFVFPKEYMIGKTTTPGTFTKNDGMFPLMYAREGLPATEAPLTDKVGFIDTTIVADNYVLMKQQIDGVNFTYNNWIKQNVDPRYYSVYEFKVPRSRFSTDQLNGSLNDTVYSDVAVNSEGQRVFPGTTVRDVENTPVKNQSVWGIDFTKVTMLKVEFSWYGAVGALFLAYVPVGNGEARWVRVHHLRASNQLKISSLGNATLPITYLVYGGGSVDRLGILDNAPKGYTQSNHVVKYGASYYIDGGDRGTVRLYSHSTTENINVFGSKYSLGSLSIANDSIGPYINVSSVSALSAIDKRYFMKAKLLTGSRADQNIEVVWTSGDNLYLSKGSFTPTNLNLIANRPSIVFGLKAKQNILNSVGTGVRNRVQVYPTKLSTASIAPDLVTTIPKVKLQLLKTPLFQPIVNTSGSFSLSSSYTITPANLPLPASSATYLEKDGDSIYGWFRANVGTVFGLLYKQGGNYYFNLLETYSDEVILLPSITFLADGRFDFNGNNLSGISEDTIQKERLSSVFVSTQIQTPIPKTGTEVTSFFLKEGSDLFDLLTYFDYNKDYLSFPLTDKVESVYLAASSTQASTGATAVAEVSSSLTWEEQ